MKYLITIIIFLAVILESNCQNTYKALYNINYSNNTVSRKIPDSLNQRDKKILLNIREKIEKSLSYVKMMDFNLDFNKENSIFYLPEQLEMDEGSLNRLKRIGKFKGKYYYNNEKMIQQKNSYGENFLVDIPKFEWNISSISKNIGSYKCYKATTTKILEGSKGILEQTVIAWFSPEIPFNFGPKEYNGLPGLIIRLDEGNNISYVLKSIKLNNDINFEKPEKGIKKTEKEFNELSKRMYENLRN